LVGWSNPSWPETEGWTAKLTKHYEPLCRHRSTSLKLYEKPSLAPPSSWPYLVQNCLLTRCLVSLPVTHMYRHYFNWQLSVATSSLSVRMLFYLVHSANRLHVQCSRVRKRQMIVVIWNKDPVCENMQCCRLTEDAHPTVWWFNCNV
jgi:hypothetical protein